MFNNGKDKANGNSTTTNSTLSKAVNIIGKGTIITGEVQTEGDLRVDGKVNGIIKTNAKVVLGPTALVEGDIISTAADISGKVIGKVEVKDLLFLKSTANIQGDIVAKKLVVEAGAVFDGTCSMGAKIAHTSNSKGEHKISKKQIAKEAV